MVIGMISMTVTELFYVAAKSSQYNNQLRVIPQIFTESCEWM